MNPVSSHELALLLVSQSPDAVVFADAEGIIRVWNTAAQRVFGFSEAQALGENLDIIIPERFREAHWRGFERALVDRASKYEGQALATRSARSDGTQIYVELSFAIVLDLAGEALGALAQARDITARYEREQANRKRIQQLEAALAKH